MPYKDTLLTKKLSLEFPIIQAPMAGGPTTPELISCVSNFGGLGSLGAGYMKPAVLDVAIKLIKEKTEKAFAVNLFIPTHAEAYPSNLEAMLKVLKPYADDLGVTLPLPTKPFVPNFDEQMHIILDHKIKVFSFTFGILEPSWVKTLKNENVTIIGTATSHLEALELEKSGVDFIVCQGKEAGGHRGTFIGDAKESLVPVFSLTEACSKHVNIPIISSGGIMHGEDIIKSLKHGAAAAQMGTAFLTTDESGCSDEYKDMLLRQKHDETTLTKAFSGKYARAIKNTFIEEMQPHEEEFLEYPIQHVLTKPLRDKAENLGRIDIMSLWAGQRAFLCKKLPCKKLLEKLAHECEQHKHLLD
ncbi:nitronate monooxygenase [Candidatus Aerophobetes bacterium]|uniref:Propionate 3-nitronate monooxygenase n=1 Tax=Aerophobetes bacterium TaxID=2030807 RepID=A0A2A4YMH9_UNCAE|nr:MAG: nitronate monooxygenase [Candidatus Aerophobetes bacterium]